MFKPRYIVLIGILLLGAYLRMGVGLLWDDGQLLHPDERFLTMVAEKVRLPHSLMEYLDSSKNPLSPYNNEYSYYVYGTLPLTIVRIIAEVFGKTDYDHIFVVGRIVSGIFDLITMVAIYLLGSALYSRQAGLIGALFLALSVQNIQLSHFMGTENFVGAFVTLTALALTYAGQYWSANNAFRARIWIILSGLMLGCGLASKISALFFLPIALLLIFGAFYFTPDNFLDKIKIRSHCIELGFGVTILFLGSTLLAFRLGQPSAFEGLSFYKISHQFLDNMAHIKETNDGGEWPPNVQWADRAPLFFTLKQMFFWEQGFGFFIASFGGLVCACYELIFRKNFKHCLSVSWILLFLCYQSTRFVKYGRYFSVIYPFLALLAGYFLVHVLYEKFKKELPSFSTIIPTALVLLSFWWAFAFVSIYSEPHTRIRASRWIYANMPQGSTILNEAWDDGLPMRVDGKDGFGGLYKEVEVNHYEIDSPKQLDELMSALRKIDYIALSSNRAYASIPRLPKRYPFTTYFYKMLFSGELGFELVHTETQYPSFMKLTMDDDSAVESFTVYDHPKVLIFKKTDRFNPDYVRERLSNFPNGVHERLTESRAVEVPWIY